MYVKIHSSKKDNNRGSCNDLINYLEKENQEKDIFSQEKFFDQKTSDVSFCTVQSSIDNNKGKLGKDDFLALLIKGTLAYAKRQRTWFRTQVKPTWFDAGSPAKKEDIILKMKDQIQFKRDIV